MTTLHEAAMRQALEALEFIRQWGEPPLGIEKRDAAIEALRSALAQQGEPIGAVDRSIPGDIGWKEWCPNLPDGTPIYAPAPQAQPPAKLNK